MPSLKCRQLLVCIQLGNNEAAERLIQELKNVYDYKFGFLLMYHSVQHRNVKLVQYLISEGCDVNAQNQDGFTPLMVAIETRDLNTVRVLLNNNADIFITNRQRKSCLELAIDKLFFGTFDSKKEDSDLILDMIFQKVSHDYSINSSSISHFLLNATNLVKFCLIIFGSAELTKFVLNSGYDINYVHPTRNFTALHASISMEKVENAKILTAHGPNGSLIDRNGHTPLKYYTDNIERLDLNSELLKVLIQICWSVSNIHNQDNIKSEVEYLLIRGNKETIRTILTSTTDVTSMTFSDQKSIVHLLTENENDDIFELLTELNIEFDVNARSRKGTALQSALLCAEVKKVELLLKLGAHANLTLPGSEPPLYFAISASGVGLTPEGTKIIELLLQHGADVQYISKAGISIVDLCSHHEMAWSSKLVMVHLALLETNEPLRFKDHIRVKIAANRILKAHFDVCKQQLKNLRSIKIYGTLTMLNLLTETDRRLMTYMRNQEISLDLDVRINNINFIEKYYKNMLQQRIAKALNRNELEKKAALAIEAFTGICSDTYHVIIYNIISYLKDHNLKTVCEAGI